MQPSELRSHVQNPKDVVKELDKYIIGQEAAKKTLALMLMSRQLLLLKRKGLLSKDFFINKSNVLLLGSTGSGKTALMKALSKVAKCVVTTYDVSSITSSGYMGDDVDSILMKHFENCREFVANNPEVDFESGVMWSTEKAVFDQLETGILYLDEIDKIRKNYSSGNDVKGDMVQSELLKFLEGGEIKVYDKKSRSGITANTKDIFVVCGGAFSGLSDMISKRQKQSSGIGFTSNIDFSSTKDTFSSVTTKDLIDYGFKPEFLGRLPLRSVLQPITKEFLVRIIREPEQSIFSEYNGIFNLFGIDFDLEPEAADLIAEEVVKLKAGARGLRSVFGVILQEYLFNVFDNMEEKIVITKNQVKEKLNL